MVVMQQRIAHPLAERSKQVNESVSLENEAPPSGWGFIAARRSKSPDGFMQYGGIRPPPSPHEL